MAILYTLGFIVLWLVIGVISEFLYTALTRQNSWRERPERFPVLWGLWEYDEIIPGMLRYTGPLGLLVMLVGIVTTGGHRALSALVKRIYQLF